ncbi:Ribonuclease H [Pseudocercospora fuligena]|uniref:ribonuclease H n=1 Tax=Pseudocercospora fuligena TaxID=685502 RepID=A0A8H6RWF7_9PEZI|nr:Ribonuclease H [Pseudocercospora fuligena]
MVYTMHWYVDGGCRGNGSSNSIAAASAIHMSRNGAYTSWTRKLPSYPRPTNQRAEITAIIIALEQTLEKYDELDSSPYLDVTILSDSRYAVNCMNDWIYKWSENGWVNAEGNEVVNRDLIQEASRLDDRVKELGSVSYKWISREENGIADQKCNEVMNEQGGSEGYYSSSDDGY